MTNPVKSRIHRRLLPLYIAAFLQGFVLWYAIEKLFMTTIGFNNATIAVMVVTYLSVMLIFEIPSGILADRWSRKGVLMLSGLALAVSSLIAGFSMNVVQYLLSALFFGIFYAFYSGTYDSIVYDTLIEEKGNCDDYEVYYGRVRLLDGLALVISSISGGLIGQIIGLRQPYLLTVPIALLSIIVLFFFREPKLHLTHEYVSVRTQVKSTFAAITKKGIIVYLLLSIIIAGLIGEIGFEFDQLWLIALAAPVVMYGPINALLLSSVIVGSGIARYFSKHIRWVVTLAVMLLIGAGLALALVRNIYIVAISEFIIEVIVIAYGIVFNKQLHDRLTSNIRAGAVSSVSSMTTILFIPIALLFGAISQQAGIFSAAWILFGLIVMVSILILKTSNGIKAITLNSADVIDQTTSGVR